MTNFLNRKQTLDIFHNLGFQDYYSIIQEFNFITVEIELGSPDKLHMVDFFSILDDSEILNIKNDPNCYFVFDYSKEGTSYKWFNFYELLERSAEKYNVPFHKIVYVSSNIKEIESYNDWCRQTDKVPQFKILIINFWDSIQFVKELQIDISIDDTVRSLRNNYQKDFLNFNRRKRPHRMLSVFNLYNSECSKNGFISCDKITDQDIIDLSWHLKNYFDLDIDIDKWNAFAEKTPLILDRSDFETNWAFTKPESLFKSTLFSLVGETLVEESWNTSGPSLFYSEKTFKPILFNHPILIIGQPDSNKSINRLGYNTYNNYFNLDFDTEKTPIDRINLVIKETSRVCKMLDNLNLESKIEWLLHDKETIIKNKEVLKEQAFNKTQISNFIKLLREEV